MDDAILPGMNLIGDLARSSRPAFTRFASRSRSGCRSHSWACLSSLGGAGWFAAAATTSPAGPARSSPSALAVGLPIAWYLASPLFIRTELIEPRRLAVTEPSPAAIASCQRRRPSRSVAPDRAEPTRVRPDRRNGRRVPRHRRLPLRRGDRVDHRDRARPVSRCDSRTSRSATALTSTSTSRRPDGLRRRRARARHAQGDRWLVRLRPAGRRRTRPTSRARSSGASSSPPVRRRAVAAA